MQSDLWNYPDELDLIEGSSVELPVARFWEDNGAQREQFTAFRMVDSQVVEDCFPQLIVTPSSTHGHY